MSNPVLGTPHSLGPRQRVDERELPQAIGAQMARPLWLIGAVHAQLKVTDDDHLAETIQPPPNLELDGRNARS